MPTSENDIIKLLMKYANSYYNGDSEITDDEFDKLEEQLKRINPNHEYFNRIGANITLGNKIEHNPPMYSLDKIKNILLFDKWLSKINLSSNEFLICEPKIDGVSANCYYENGHLKHVSTRGNGFIGLKLKIVNPINNLPTKINIKGNVDIRGEFYIKKDTYQTLQDKPLRNVCAGLINRMIHRNSIDPEMSYVHFIPYDIIFKNKKTRDKTYGFVEDILKLLKSNFKKNISYFKININQIVSTIDEYVAHLRNQWEYETDGLVFIVNNRSLHNKIDSRRIVRRYHHYAMAFKPPSEVVSTKIIDIVFDVSRLGKIIPIGIVKPIRIKNSDISRITLNNISFLKKLDLCRNDTVEITKANDVIPKLVNVKKSNGTPFMIPEICPSCNHKLVFINKNLICENNNCKEKNIKKLLHWVSVNKIPYLGEQTIRTLYNNGCHSIYDLYTKDITAILLAENGYKDKKINNILQSLNKSKNISEKELLVRIGIPGVSKHNINVLDCDTINEFLDKYNNNIITHTLYKTEEYIITWLKNKDNINLLTNMKSILYS